MSNHELMSIDDQTLANIMNKRHRSAKCNFKNPPQPKFCIREKTLDGQEVFINVLSYSRIANQLSEFDPIPLYFGMQIRSFSSIKSSAYLQQHSPSPQLIFAVMASPEVLKNFGRGRSCVESAEQMNLVELMCEFVEAMNPGIILSKKPEILKDRDLAGELKDVWSAVQSFRDKEKAGVSDIVVYTEFGPDSALDSNGKSVLRNDSIQSETFNANDNAQSFSDMQNYKEKENEDEKAENFVRSFDESDSQDIEIDQLSLLDNKKMETKNHEQDNEKIVKIQNQKNKESQHTFFPKFLSSSKDRESKDKDKEKEKEKQQEELEPKGKNKKSLNFFRRNKSSSSPTHTNNNNSKNNQKSDSNADH